MKIQFNHFWGSQERGDLCLTECSAEVDPSEEKYALENGWVYDKRKWHQVRSTRIVLDEYKPIKKISKDITGEWVNDVSEYRNALENIYYDYITVRSLTDSFNPFESDDEGRDFYLILKCSGELCGFSKILVHTGGVESVISPWHSNFKKYSLGWAIIDFECKESKSRGFEHLYIGAGYDKGSLYKSKIPGFEWWNGSSWSRNLELYDDLCVNDTNVHTFDDLMNTKNRLTNQ
jgi:hypothetical protein